MRERRYGAETLVKTNCEGGEDGRPVRRRSAVERFLDMLQTGLHRDAVAGQQCELRRSPGETFERCKTVFGGKLPDRIHASVKIEGRKTGTGAADFRDAQPYLGPNDIQRLRRHDVPLGKQRRRI